MHVVLIVNESWMAVQALGLDLDDVGCQIRCVAATEALGLGSWSIGGG